MVDLFGAKNPNYKGYMHKKCLVCGKELGSGAKKTSKYCSKECQIASQRKTNELKTCPTCGKNFLHKGKYCSVECRVIRDYETLSESAKQKRRLRLAKLNGETIRIGAPKVVRQPKTCEVCGKGMLLRPCEVKKGTKYCSRECYGKAVAERQSGEKHHNYKDGKSLERWLTHQLVRRSIYYKTWRKKVFERDGYSCRSCLKQGGVLHAHHVVPWVDDPKLRLKVSNGVTLCSECHRLWHMYDKKGYFEGKEALLQAKIKEALENYGFLVYNVPGTTLGVNGVSDLILCFNGLFGAVEVKVFPNYLSELQRVFGKKVKAAGGLFYVAQSEDDVGKIIEMFETKIAYGSWLVDGSFEELCKNDL